MRYMKESIIINNISVPLMVDANRLCLPQEALFLEKF